ncbi:monovalent cation:proton antiporter [Desulfitispora alkaliphila]|uniref:Na(+)/H(+) antiporter subunit B n=1 Tax=Desulfitispora alkaliphila TaxID=622674 RepID=UPI003D22994C
MRQNNVILQTVARMTLHLILAFSIFMFFAGHNNPGGGFIAGLMTAAALVLQYIAFGGEMIKKSLPVDFKKVTAFGLLLAAGTGIVSMLFGYPFLTQFFDYYMFPIFGEIELTTALPFDLGVYLAVVGATMTVILTIGEDV